MSAEAVTVVLHHSNAEGAAKLVLWGIANHHSDQGAWPSISTLAKYANIKERRVQQIIRQLAADGEIAIQEQGGYGNGQYKTNRYLILLTCPNDCDGTLQHRTGVHSVTVRGAISDNQGCNMESSGVQPTAPEPNKNLYKEPNKNLTAQKELFKEFWKEYPRKLDRAKAERAFNSALTRASLEDILAGAIKYKNDPNRIDEYTKYPATWLNADAWENGPLPYDARAQKKREAAEQEKIMKEWGNESE